MVFPARKVSASMIEMQSCLKWLANLHAIFMDKKPTGLWPVGTYWHLDTRPDELDVMEDFELKTGRNPDRPKTPYESISKPLCMVMLSWPTFCFSSDGQQVAAVDFQYVGGGCGN